MKQLRNGGIELTYEPSLEDSVQALVSLMSESAHAVRPVRKIDEKASALYASRGFQLYPTVLKTTLFHDSRSDCFFKVLHPLDLKHRMIYAVTDRAYQIFTLCSELKARGIPLPGVTAYGTIRETHAPVFAMERVRGTSLYNTFVLDGKPLNPDLGLKVMDAIAAFHRLGYWFGDAHLSHIFMDGADVTGFIDVDSIKRNLRSGVRNFAKDLSGLNHPRLPLTDGQKKEFVDHYLEVMKIRNRPAFLGMLKRYSERRWER
ncbi:MAG TPA: hypothetical protein VEP69_02330 [Thermodesulfovibrionales bacterium]|nr:hypothetical protein [Thermodesulfovibrionales bacterium]